MYVFGASAVPKEVKEGILYRPHKVYLGADSYDSPIIVDIKPMFYVYYGDIDNPFFCPAIWVDDFLGKVVSSISEATNIIDPEVLSEWLLILEAEIWDVISPFKSSIVLEA